MLDPRIYRMGLVPAVFAVIVLAFSLQNPQTGLTTNLAPDAYVGANALQTINALATGPAYHDPRPGSQADANIAGYVASRLGQYGFSVARDYFNAGTVDGPRLLENVIGTQAGPMPGTIVVVAHRDSAGAASPATLSGTAVLLELGRLLQGQTQHHTIVLASTTGAVGAAGAAALARELPRPVDAVIVLGDLAAQGVREPVVVPWSDGQALAPTMLRNTLAGALRAQAGLSATGNGLGGQLAHLAFPMAPSEQAPFGSAGLPSVLVSLSGDRLPSGGEPTSPSRITATGRALVQALGALDAGPSIPAPSAYLLWSGKVVPAWAIRLLVLALILPVGAAVVDGLARAHRRRIPILRSVVWVLAAASPFVAAAVVVGIARLLGLLTFLPGIPVQGGAVPLGGAGVGVLVAMGVAILGGLLWLRPAMITLAGGRQRGDTSSDGNSGPAIALVTVLCVLALIVWLANPFAALLLVPGLHLWMWIASGEKRLPRPVLCVLLAGGLALPALVALYYAIALGTGPVGLAWSWVLLLAGGAVHWTTAVEWSVFAGCAVSVVAIVLRGSREPAPEPVPITIRGPVTYAGPGSLGGTSSALRR